ncbi:MAG: hypothetical protein ACREE7_03860 [Dongiaceae bacterium]
MNFRTLCLVTALGLSLGMGGAAAQDSSSKYQQWPGADAGSDDINQLVQDIQKLIDAAERDKAADPQFLDDLRGVLADYQNPWTTRLLYDDFRDGNYTANPAWTVSGGVFKVKKDGFNIGLKSSVIPQGVAQQQQSTGNVVLDILGAVNQQQPTSFQYSAIYTPLRITNAFATRIEFTSVDRFGRMDFGPYLGQSGGTAYRVAYLPGQTRDSLRLIRITPRGAVAIATYKGGLNLEDGRRHVLEWTRDRNGAMTVVLDGRDMMQVTDRTINKPFDGFLMINSGGTYWVRSVTVDGGKG